MSADYSFAITLTASDDTTDSSSESDPDEPSAADSSSLDPEPASEQARDNPQPPREQGTPSARATNAQEPRVLRYVLVLWNDYWRDFSAA